LHFRGHDESKDSSNQGNFLKLLRFIVKHNENVKVVALKNAHENHKLIAPDIQKDIVSAATIETSNTFIRDLGDAFFFFFFFFLSVLIYESHQQKSR
jgi:hypothetical protein